MANFAKFDQYILSSNQLSHIPAIYQSFPFPVLYCSFKADKQIHIFNIIL